MLATGPQALALDLYQLFGPIPVTVANALIVGWAGLSFGYRKPSGPSTVLVTLPAKRGRLDRFDMTLRLCYR
jgi:hypothetical protein